MDNIYIVLDLEWNQSSNGKDGSVPDIPFEIIEIGAVKLDNKLNKISEYHAIVKPQIYEKMHFMVREIVHIGIDELRAEGRAFDIVAREFIDWCYSDGKPIFCTWGNMDLTELERNLAYYDVPSPFPYPLLYYDIQKLWSKLYDDKVATKPPLDMAVSRLELEDDRPFHRASDDAYYTAAIMRAMDFESVKDYLSIDYYHIPRNRSEEIYMCFPDYTKFVSCTFDNKEDMLDDNIVSSILCPRCNKKLKKKIRWFSTNQKVYHAIAICQQHGFIKGKIRIKSSHDLYYAIKTIKCIDIAVADKMTDMHDIYVKKRNAKNNKRRKLKKEYKLQ